MSSEDQQQWNRFFADCSPISRASSHPRVEDRNIVDVFAADSNAIHNGSEVETRFNNDDSGLAPHDNYEESGSDQRGLHDVSLEFTNSNPTLAITNAVENGNELENFSGGSRPSVSDTINTQAMMHDIGDGLHLDSENASQCFNLLQQADSSSSPMLSLENQVAPESGTRPRGKNSKSAISEQAEEAQPGPSSLAVRKSRQHRTPTGEQAEEAQPRRSSLAVRKPQRTPTDEQAEEAQPGPSSLAVRKSQRHCTPTRRYDSSVEEIKTPRQSRRKVSPAPDGESEPTAEEELEVREIQGWINPMLDQLWQWATPALFEFEEGPKYYKRCFTGTPETPNLSFKLGDAVELMSPEPSKYLGIVVELYQRHRREEDRYTCRYLDQRVHTVWLYLISDILNKKTADARDKLRKKGLNLESALFISTHSDVNPMQKVQHAVKLLSVKEYLSNPSKRNSNEYYLAGFYNPYWSEVHLRIRGNFSLLKFFRYDSLKQQALMGNSFTIPAKDWYKS